MKLKQLGEAVGGIDYVSVGSAVKRFEQRLLNDDALAQCLRLARQRPKIQNAEM